MPAPTSAGVFEGVLDLGEVVPHIARALHHQQRQQDHHGGMAEGEEQAHGHGAFVLLHQFPGHVVDGSQVVGVNGVLESEAVSPEAPAQQDHVGMKDGQGQHQAARFKAKRKR